MGYYRELTGRESRDDFTIERHGLVVLLGGVIVLVCEQLY
jgi:hypothetical protein